MPRAPQPHVTNRISSRLKSYSTWIAIFPASWRVSCTTKLERGRPAHGRVPSCRNAIDFPFLHLILCQPSNKTPFCLSETSRPTEQGDKAPARWCAALEHPLRQTADRVSNTKEAWHHVLNQSRTSIPGERDLLCAQRFVEALSVHTVRRRE